MCHWVPSDLLVIFGGRLGFLGVHSGSVGSFEGRLGYFGSLSSFGGRQGVVGLIRGRAVHSHWHLGNSVHSGGPMGSRDH